MAKVASKPNDFQGDGITDLTAKSWPRGYLSNEAPAVAAGNEFTLFFSNAYLMKLLRRRPTIEAPPTPHFGKRRASGRHYFANFYFRHGKTIAERDDKSAYMPLLPKTVRPPAFTARLRHKEV